jgi:hypothetical protein
MDRYREIEPHAPDYEPLPFYSSDADLADWLRDTSSPAGDGEGEGEAEVLGASFGGDADRDQYGGAGTGE